MKKRKKLIVFSADAMVTEDLALLETLPNFQKYLAGGCRINRVRSVYPTITYACHTTMASGVYPELHGIPGNFKFCPGNLTPPWHWFSESVKFPESIFKSVKEAGYSTAAIYWPVTGNHPYIDYLIDEYWTQFPGDTIREAYRRSGSSEAVLDIIDRHKEGVTLRQHPGCDQFIMDCAGDIIRQFQPDLLMIHPANVDDFRHRTGLFTPEVEEQVVLTDRWIGRLMAAAEEAGVGEETNFVLTSDHGQIEIKRTLNLNVFLADRGFLTVENGELKDWRAYCLSGGTSGLVYLKDPQDQGLYSAVYSALRDMAEEGIYGISQVFTEPEIREKEHLGGEFSFVVESDGYTSFGDNWNRPAVIGYDQTDYRRGRATHGHLPGKGPQPIFLAKGPDFREDVTLETGRLIDQAPTYAKLLGVEIPGAQGRAIEEFLRQG
ncbi:MAG: alkaline phosphatase family protein [Oscillibacter sp.]|nr:alkaline phosphatase family protein [Oscillibacter sp.]